jgi:hypothetical protein
MDSTAIVFVIAALALGALSGGCSGRGEVRRGRALPTRSGSSSTRYARNAMPMPAQSR